LTDAEKTNMPANAKPDTKKDRRRKANDEMIIAAMKAQPRAEARKIADRWIADC